MSDILERLESEVLALPERPEMTVDDACLLLTKIDAAMKRAREMKAQLEAFLIGWLPDHGGEMVIGDVVHFVTNKKKVKCRNIPAAIDAILIACEGEVAAMADVLSSDAIKVGAARKLLGDAKFEELFETRFEEDLDHKPVKVLASVNKAFVK